MLITKDWLRNWGACNRALRTFGRLWPKGARITKRNLIRASAHPDLRLNWLALYIFEGDERLQWYRAKGRAEDSDSMARLRLITRYDHWSAKIGRERAIKKIRYSKRKEEMRKAYNLRLALAFWAIWQRSLKKGK